MFCRAGLRGNFRRLTNFCDVLMVVFSIIVLQCVLDDSLPIISAKRNWKFDTRPIKIYYNNNSYYHSQHQYVETKSDHDQAGDSAVRVLLQQVFIIKR